MDGNGRAHVLGVAVLLMRSIRTFSATSTVTRSARTPERYATACGYPGLSCRQQQL